MNTPYRRTIKSVAPPLHQIKRLKKQGGDWTWEAINQMPLGITGQNLRGSKKQRCRSTAFRRCHRIQIDASDTFQFIAEKIEPEGRLATGRKNINHVATKGKIPGLGNDGRSVITGFRQSLHQIAGFAMLPFLQRDQPLMGFLSARCALHQRGHTSRHQHGGPFSRPPHHFETTGQGRSIGQHIGSNRVERREMEG